MVRAPPMSARTICISKTWPPARFAHSLPMGPILWVYEEELNVRDGFRWAPDGRSLAFWQFDLTGVEQFAIVNNTDSLYPKIVNIPYPKVGLRHWLANTLRHGSTRASYP